MKDCDNLSKCGFFRKYEKSLNLACKGFINTYCTGGKMADCQRLKYKLLHGVSPEDDMMPSGQMVPTSMRV